MVRRRIEQTRPPQHAGWEGEPNRVPVRLNLASCRPSRAGSAVKFLERGGIQEERLQRHKFPFNSIEYLRKSGARPTNFSIRKVPVVAVGRSVIAASLTLLWSVRNLLSPGLVKIRCARRILPTQSCAPALEGHVC